MPIIKVHHNSNFLKWSAPKWPSELRDHPEAVADIVLFNEVQRLVNLCG